MYLLPRLNGNETQYIPYATVEAAIGAQVVNRSSVGALAFLVWDILITMDDEVNLIWPRSISYTKIVYFLVRYIPVLVHISILFIGTEITPHFHFTSHDCYIWQIFQGTAVAVIVTLVDTILILRIHALYHGNSPMRMLVFGCFILEVIGMIIGLAISLPKITYDRVCLVLSYPHSLIIYGASSIAFQTFLFIITLFKFLQAARSGWGDVPLLVLLARDGTWAFFLLFGVYAAQGFLFLLSNKAYSGLLYAWLLSAFSFAGYRILLNINKLANGTLDAATRTSNGRRTDTNIQFTTQLFESESAQIAQTEFYELATSAQPQHFRRGRRTERSQISTLSLGP